MKKDQNVPHKNIHSNNSAGKPLPNNSNYSRQKSPYNPNYRGRSPNQRNPQNLSQNRYSRSNSRNNQYRNNYSRSKLNRPEFSFNASSNSNSKKDFIQMTDLETLHIKEIEIIPTIRMETNQLIEIMDIKKIDHAIILTTDQTIKDQNIITIKTDHWIVHRPEIEVITTDKETTLNHHKGIRHVIKFHNKIIEVVNLNIKGK